MIMTIALGGAVLGDFALCLPQRIMPVALAFGTFVAGIGAMLGAIVARSIGGG